MASRDGGMVNMSRLVSCFYSFIGLLTLITGPCMAVDSGHTPCQPPWFQCGNSTKCVHQKYWCDNITHCDYGEDEDYKNCQHNGAWWKDFSSKHSNKSVNVTAVNSCSISHPAVCECSDYTRIDCKNKNLTRIPSDISPNTTRLVIGRNLFKVVPNDAFMGLTQVKVLSLANCGIHHISNNAFVSLDNLEKLVLENNSLVTLDKGTFTHIPKLTWLFMSDNRLIRLPSDLFMDLYNLEWIRLINNSLTLVEDFPTSITLNWLELENNHIEVIKNTTFSKTPNITFLLLNNNSIHSLEVDAFSSMRKLAELGLTNNKIRFLPEGIFRHNKELETLYLNSNPLIDLPMHIFKFNTKLVSLYLADTFLENIHPETFKHLTRLEHAYMRYYDHCYLLPHVKDCHPKTDGISDSKNLLAYPILRIAVWLVAVITLVGNAVVMLGRVIDMFREKDKSIHLLSVTNLSAADFLMGLYLLIVAAFDEKFRDVFDVNYIAWTKSAGCQISGFIGMVSSEVSILILAYMSLERYLNSSSPYRTGTITLKTACVFMLCIWTVGLILAAVPLIPVWGIWGFYGTNGVCFPLHIHRPYKTGWEYSMFVFIVINSCALLVMIVCYTALYKNIQKTQKPVKKMNSVAKTADNWRIFLFVVTDSLCWIPIIVVKLGALSHVSIPNSLHAWVAIFLLPVNSAINPLIYSLTTLTFRRKFLRIFCSKRFQRFARKFSVGRRSTTSSFNLTVSVTRESNNTDGQLTNGHIGVRRTPSTEVTYLTCPEIRESVMNNDNTPTEDVTLIEPVLEEDV